MAIRVFRAFTVIENSLIDEADLPQRSRFRCGDVAGVLTNLPRSADAGPAWDLEMTIGTGTTARRVTLRLEAFLTPELYQESEDNPISFDRVSPNQDPPLSWLWLFRNALYVTERMPRVSELAEVVLRIKALHFERDEELRRLKEQVANFEAIVVNISNGPTRRTIPDDVKLLVWSRDGGACVKCGAPKDLHFDHVIPLARGGSDEAENIQLLCRSCNLKKQDRLV